MVESYSVSGMKESLQRSFTTGPKGESVKRGECKTRDLLCNESWRINTGNLDDSLTNSHRIIHTTTSMNWIALHTCIRWRSDYIIGFVTPVIGPNKFKKLTRLTAPEHNTRGKVWMKNIIHNFTDNNWIVFEVMHVVFHSNFAAYIVCRHYKPCGFFRFVWTDYWGNKFDYVISSPAN